MDVALIVENITGYLDMEDLLQIRLVNNLWNESAKLTIKKCFISLGTDEICKLMELFPDCFPLLKFDILVDLRIQNLKNLIQKFGKSIKAYRFNGREYDSASAEFTEALMDILRNSPNLQILEIYKNITRCIVLQTELNCVLPKLKSFTFECCPRPFGQIRDQETSFLKKILDASPQLQYLKIKNIDVELSSLIAVVANRNIKAVHLKPISENSFQHNSTFNGKCCMELASVSVKSPYAHITKFNEFLQKYSHTIRYLKIKGIIMHSVEFPAMKYLETLKLGEYDGQDNSQVEFYQGQFPSLKGLRLNFLNSQKLLNYQMNWKLPFQNLKWLELIFCRWHLDEDGRLPASIELPLCLPSLELLGVRSHSVTNIIIPETVNLRKLIMYNGFEFERIHLQFPNLKVLHLKIDKLDIGSELKDLWKLFETLAGLEELTLELRHYSPGTLWKILSGLARKDKAFINEIINIMRSNMTSLAQELLSKSKPNLGNLIALRSLTVQGSEHMDASIAIAFLVFCGKLKNLTKLETSLLESSQRYFEIIFGDIFSSNNTRYQFLSVPEDYTSLLYF